MAAVPPVLISQIPPFPALSDRALGTYNSKAYTFGTHMGTTFDTEFNNSVTNVSANATVAFDAAVASAAAQVLAVAAKDAAVAAAASAIGAPGTNSTSTSSLTLSLGVKNAVTQAGKIYPPGLNIVVARTSSPTTQMGAVVNTYNDVTGAINFTVGSFVGSGTYTDWTISNGLSAGGGLPAITNADIGKAVVVAAGPVFALAATRGSDAAVQAPNTTIATGAAAVLTVTPTSYGQWVKLPDATGYAKGLGVLQLRNGGGYDLTVLDNAGTPVTFIHAGEAAVFSLADISSAAGVWVVSGGDLVGAVVAADIPHGLSSPTNLAVREVIELDADRELLILCSSVATQAIVWNNATGLFGALATVRTHDGGNRVRAIKSAANQALVISSDSTTAVQGVVLSISGTAITVNTAAPFTAAAAMATATAAGAYGDLVPVVGQGFVYSYARSSNVNGLRAITITGTTVAFGAEALINSAFVGNSTIPVFDMGSSRIAVIYAASAATPLTCAPYTVSGTTLTVGTPATVANMGANDSFIACKLLSGRIAVIGPGNAANLTGAIFAVTGTVASVTTVSFSSGVGTPIAWKLFGNQVLFAANLTGNSIYANVLTDVGGTATAGTAITRSGAALLEMVRCGSDATSISVLWGGGSDGRSLWKLSITGGNPTLLANTYVAAGTPTGASSGANASYPTFGMNNTFGAIGRFELPQNSLEHPGTGSGTYTGGHSAGIQQSPLAYRSIKGTQMTMVARPSVGINDGRVYARENLSVLWACGATQSGSPAYQLTKLKAA